MIGNCRTTIESFGALLDGVITPDAETALRSHLAICPRCTEFLESYRSTGRIVRASTDVSLPWGLEQRLMERLKGLLG